MARQERQFPYGAIEMVEATRTRGTILCAGGPSGPNGMAIGWITIGSIWGRPICTVLARPSRHTFTVMETGDSFTVNLLSEKLQDAVTLFGTKSGRDGDKFAEAGVTAAKGRVVASPYIAEADLVIECKIAARTPLDPKLFSADFVRDCYRQDDHHMVYYGEIASIHIK